MHLDPTRLAELKAKHPYPGGWREGPTETEWAAWRALVKKYKYRKPQGHISTYQLTWHKAPPTRVVEGRLHATRSWLLGNIFMDWEATSLSNFMVKHPEVRRVKGGTKLACFDVSDALKLVASIQLIKPKIRHSVFRVLQGSGSINEKLLEFVAATE